MSRKVYSKDFIQQIVSLYSSGKTVMELSSEYGIPNQTVSRWCQRYVKSIDAGNNEKISLDDIKNYKKEIARLRLENEILKKATAIFAKEN